MIPQLIRYLGLKALEILQAKALDAAIEHARKTGKFKTPDFYLFQFLESSSDSKEHSNLSFDEKSEQFQLRLKNGNYIDPLRWLLKGKQKARLDNYYKHFGSSKALDGTDLTPAYFRARERFIELLLTELSPDDPSRKILRNGVIPSSFDEQAEVEQILKAERFSSAPLSFKELTSFNTWFMLHPEKVAGKEVITSSREFPITIKGSKEDVLRTLQQSVSSKKSEFSFTLQVKQKSAKAKLKLLQL